MRREIRREHGEKPLTAKGAKESREGRKENLSPPEGTEEIWDRIISDWVLWRSKKPLERKDVTKDARVAKKAKLLVKISH